MLHACWQYQTYSVYAQENVLSDLTSDSVQISLGHCHDGFLHKGAMEMYVDNVSLLSCVCIDVDRRYCDTLAFDVLTL